MRVTILGCGTSTGVPMVGSDPPIKRSPNPKDRRRRCSAYIETDGQAILIDTPPDLRCQLLDADVKRIDALLYTHTHADHLHGIDDLRGICIVQGRPIDTFAHPQVLADIKARFPYPFAPWTEKPAFYRPVLVERPFEPYRPFAVGPVEVLPFEQRHARLPSWGFRLGRFAYSTDVVDFDERAFAALEGIEVWVVDGLRMKPHPSHAHIPRVLEWVERLGPRKTYLTHMNHEVFYDATKAWLPDHVEPAYDGLVIEL